MPGRGRGLGAASNEDRVEGWKTASGATDLLSELRRSSVKVDQPASSPRLCVPELLGLSSIRDPWTGFKLLYAAELETTNEHAAPS